MFIIIIIIIIIISLKNHECVSNRFNFDFLVLEKKGQYVNDAYMFYI